jgi:hypothetical protein
MSSPAFFARRHFTRLLSAAFLVFASGLDAATIPLVSRGDQWRHRGGVAAPQANWQSTNDAALDSTWLTNAGGFGYGDPGIVGEAFTISGMVNVHRTYAIRRTFNVAGPLDTNMHLRLTADFDDGYAAWLDGNLIASNNSPAGLGWNVSATASREASCCNSPNPPLAIGLGAVLDRLPPGDHVLAILGYNQGAGSSDFHMIFDLDLVDAPVIPPGIVPVGGTLGANTTWYRTNTYLLTSSVTVASGVTLTIEPGTTVLFNQGLSLNVSGRLLADGHPTNRIFFTRNTGVTSWSTLEFLANSATSRVTFADIAFSTGNIDATDTTVYLENLSFSNTTAQLIDLVRSSVTLLDTFIPSVPTELIHFSDMPANGHALVQGCVFGVPSGYNDNVDFTGGNRPGPIVQFLDNVFLSGVDDCFDMDGTDAHIEGNIFLNVRKDAARDSSSNPITTGANGADRSELVICRNIIFDCEHAFMEKDHGTAILQNNTVLRITPNPFSANTSANGNEASGIIMFGEPWRAGPPPPGDGVIFEGNIGSDLQVADPWPILPWAQANPAFFFVRNFNCVQGFPQPGLGNISADPLFVSPSNLTAANIRQSLALQPGSPCLGAGPNGIDMGAIVPAGASISGEPMGATTNTSATLKVAGPGIWAYRWKLNDGPWSAEISLVPQAIWGGQPFTGNMFSNAPPITLTNLTNGAYTVRVIGKNSAGFWQNTNSPAVSKTWTVQSGPLAPRIESVARLGTTVTLTFIAQAGQTYSLRRSDTLHPPDWRHVTDAGPPAVTGLIPIADTNATPATRFYQLVTPAQP